MTAEERAKLVELARRQKTANAVARRARRGSFQSVHSLEKAIHDYRGAHIANVFVWTATADKILESLRRFCLRFKLTVGSPFCCGEGSTRLYQDGGGALARA